MQTYTKETLKIFWRHARKYPWHVAAIIAGVLIVTGFRTYTPVLYRDLIDALTKGPAYYKEAVFFVFFIFGWSFAGGAVRRIWNFVNSFFQSRVMANLTNSCFEYLQKHSYGFFTSKFVGSLVTKVKRYERSFETIADQITYDLGQSLLEVAGILVVLFLQYKFFAWIMLAWIVLFLIFAYIFARFKLPYDIRRAATDTRVTAQLADGITNNVNIKTFTAYSRENERFAGVTDEQHRARKKSWDLNTINEIIQNFSMIVLEFLILYFAVQFWQKGTLTVADVALLQVFILRTFDKLWNTGKNIQRIYEATADANEMTELLMQPHAVQDAIDSKTLLVTKGAVEFKDVTFNYHKNVSVLEKFSLSIKPGERVAFVGPSGGGKSTILKLLMRFYDVTSGTILIDGQDISKTTQDSLRSALSLVPQDPILFHRTLTENIRYAKPSATDEEVIRAAKLAHAHEFITKLSHGYDTLVGERGIKLSGGERQRVAIARAILKDAPILILDEATSSLDSESEMFIQDALKTLMKERTTIVVAHRLSTIMQMDRIVVISGGKIIEEGGHTDLLKVQEGMYQKLWHIQAGGFASA